MKTLVAIPVHNEETHLAEVLRRALQHRFDILVVDDGSTDGTPQVLWGFPEVHVLRHAVNRGYGAALRAAFDYACSRGYDLVITMDSDGQHEPALIPRFLPVCAECDIVSGSRYRDVFETDMPAPKDRQRINTLVTDELNACFDLGITDAFCGFKAYRTRALRRLDLREAGYGMPLELWVQAACLDLRVCEVAIPRIYHDLTRSFGETLDDAKVRLAYYQEVIDRAVARTQYTGDCGLPYSQLPTLQKVDC